MSSDKAFLLDLICRRYGGRPSDYVPDLDEYEAFQFDAGIAFRYTTSDNDDDNEKLNAILNAIGAVMRTLGNKKIKHEKYERVVKFTDDSKKGNIVDAGITNMTVTEVVEK